MTVDLISCNLKQTFLGPNFFCPWVCQQWNASPCNTTQYTTVQHNSVQSFKYWVLVTIFILFYFIFSAILVYLKIYLSNCSRNEWNPKWSVVILSDLHKIVWWQSEVWFVTQGYEIQTELDNTRSCYQLIKSMTKF